ncbi:MAG: alpha/beta hydrolase [Chroococcidiopsidaceae cyanobacterium CP_BM_ER_R8_30]|nr:alpha/beta hydrolase [Chroococcidiopsidaceae cyanobacterium CP_BM_ER_R8_30]
MIELGEMRLILIHGFGCSSADWSSQLDSLTRLADVIALDLPGQGDAKHPARSLIGEMAEAVNDVRRIASSARTVLVGHSMGCRVALEAARRMPKAIVGIVLIEGSLRAIGNPDEAVRRHRSHSTEENKVLLKQDFAGMFSGATPAAFRRLVSQRIEMMDSEFAARLMEDMTWWDAADAASALHAVRTPMLVIQSTYKEPGVERRSINVEEMSPWLRLISEQAASRAEIVRLAELGHFPQVEAPTLINTLISAFIERLKLLH